MLQKPLSLFAFVAVLTLTVCSAGVQGALVDDFETYENTQDLEGAWKDDPNDDPVQKLETAVVAQGAKSLRFDYNVSGGTYLDRIVYTFDADQNWSSFSSVTFQYKGTATNSVDKMFFELKDEYGSTIGKTEKVGAGTRSSTWTSVRIDISGYGNPNLGISLHNVRKIIIGALGKNDYGKGTIYLDQIRVE